MRYFNKTTSERRRDAYARDLDQFLEFHGIEPDHWEHLLRFRPEHIQQWRDSLTKAKHKPRTIRRKITTLRGLYTCMKNYGYTGANPADPDFVTLPPEPTAGVTVAMTRQEVREMLDAPDPETPVGIRDRAWLAFLAYGGLRVDELCNFKVGDVKMDAEHRVMRILGKGSKEREGAVAPEAVERFCRWLDVAGIRDDLDGPLFRPPLSPRGKGRDGFKRKHLTTRAMQLMVKKYVTKTGINPHVTVHSFRVTAANEARKQGVEIVNLQPFLGHKNIQTTLWYPTRNSSSRSSPSRPRWPCSLGWGPSC